MSSVIRFKFTQLHYCKLVSDWLYRETEVYFREIGHHFGTMTFSFCIVGAFINIIIV